MLQTRRPAPGCDGTRAWLIPLAIVLAVARAGPERAPASVGSDCRAARRPCSCRRSSWATSSDSRGSCAGSAHRGGCARVLDPFYGVARCRVPRRPGDSDRRSRCPDGMQAMISIEKGLSGEGINETIPLFSAPARPAARPPAAPGAARLPPRRRGRRGRPGPARAASGRLVRWARRSLGVMAEARLAAIHYFAPAFVVSLCGAFWLLRRARLGTAPMHRHRAGRLPRAGRQLENRHARPYDPGARRRASRRPLRALEARLRPGELGRHAVVLARPGHALLRRRRAVRAPTPRSTRTASSPTPAARPSSPRTAACGCATTPARLRGTSSASSSSCWREIGTYRVRPVPGVPDAVELLSGPGTGR